MNDDEGGFDPVVTGFAGNLKWCLLHNQDTAYAYALRGLMMGEVAEIEEGLADCFSAYYRIVSGDFRTHVVSQMGLTAMIQSGLPLFLKLLRNPPSYKDLTGELQNVLAARNRLAHSVWMPHPYHYLHPSASDNEQIQRWMVRRRKIEDETIDVAKLEEEVIAAQNVSAALFDMAWEIMLVRGWDEREGVYRDPDEER